MKILVVFTGGTIGCSVQRGSLDIAETKDYYLLSEFTKRNPEKSKGIVFETIEPLQVLSENMTVEKWNVLICAFQKIDFDNYDGIIVTHGTDTMAYTASLFSFLLAGIKIPVFFVGSNYNLFDERADGHDNFLDSVMLIQKQQFCGVFVTFKSRLFIASRIKQSKHFVDAYDSIDGECYGTMKDGELILNRSQRNPSLEELSNMRSEPLIYRISKLQNTVFALHPYVGLNYSAIQLPAGIKAVLHGTYHSFTTCVDGDSDFSILRFVQRCTEKDISVYLAPFKGELTGENAVTYASTSKVLKSNIRVIGDMSYESAYCKLLLAYSLYREKSEVQSFLNQTIFFETI